MILLLLLNSVGDTISQPRGLLKQSWVRWYSAVRTIENRRIMPSDDVVCRTNQSFQNNNPYQATDTAVQGRKMVRKDTRGANH